MDGARDGRGGEASTSSSIQGLSPKVFHRDIKPQNLIARPDGSVALVDFGSARDRGATVGATLVGTFGYMPVEQLGGIVDSTTDLYALGSTMFHLLTRREPWHLCCPRCDGRLRLVALMTEPKEIRRYLVSLGEEPDAPTRSAARGPPYWRSLALRRRAGDVDAA